MALAVVIGSGLLLLLRNPLLSQSFNSGMSTCSSMYTCKLCGSTRSVERRCILGVIPIKSKEQITYKSPGFSSCKHVWSPGISNAVPTPVKNGVVVLVRENGKYGAFILRNQSSDPERAEYDWWYQSNGSGSFDTNSPTVTSGRGATPRIRFGNFDIFWSAESQGTGWIYYKHYAGDKVSSGDLHLCVIDLNSVHGINAATPEWKYKATPVD